MFSRITAIAALTFTALHAYAGPVQMERIAADAEWVVHLDVEGFLNSRIGKVVLEVSDLAEHHGDLAQIREEYGIDPLTVLKDFTAYGKGDPQADDAPFVAIFTASPEVDELINMIKASGEHQRLELAGYQVEKFQDAFFHVRPGLAESPRVIILAKDAERLVRAVAVADGRGPSAADRKEPALDRPAAGSFLFVSADGLDWIDVGDDGPGSAILRDAEGMRLDIGERGEIFFVNMALRTKDEDTASNLGDIVRGLVAMARLAAGTDPQFKEYRQLLQARVKTNGNSVSISVEQNVEKLGELLRKTVGDEVKKLRPRATIKIDAGNDQDD